MGRSTGAPRRRGQQGGKMSLDNDCLFEKIRIWGGYD